MIRADVGDCENCLYDYDYCMSYCNFHCPNFVVKQRGQDECVCRQETDKDYCEYFKKKQ